MAVVVCVSSSDWHVHVYACRVRQVVLDLVGTLETWGPWDLLELK